MNNPIRISSVLSIGRHISSTHRRHQTGKNRIAIAANDQKFTVRTFIGIRWHNAGDCGARWLTYHSGTVVLWDNSFEQIKHRFIECHVDYLTTWLALFSRLISRTQRHQNTDHRVQA